MLAFLGLVLAAAATAILSAEFGWTRLFYAAKPLTTLLILAQAVARVPASSAARIPLLVALGLSLAGDVFLMLPGDRFRPGLLSFLAAHVAFIWAFSTRLAGPPPVGALLVVLGLVSVLWLSLRKNLGSFAVPVAAYSAVLALMVWTAWGTMVALRSQAGRMAFVGAGLFLLSDAILAVRRFRRPFRGGQALTLSSYYAGLVLISLSFQPALVV